MQDYLDFLDTKHITAAPAGFDVAPDEIHPRLFQFQRDIVRWAAYLGRAAIFANVGLGKTLMQLEWARLVSDYTRGPVLILAPLAVAPQTIREGEDKLGLSVVRVQSADECRVPGGIFITNYDSIHKFDLSHFTGVVLDESSILKHYSKTFFGLTHRFEHIPFRLCCTATPAPNDYVEFGNHSTFLDVMHFKDMLARFFVGEGDLARLARLKGHASAEFWRWLTSWAVSLSRPADLGPEYDMPGYDLPPLHVHEYRLPAPKASLERAWNKGQLLPDDSASVTQFHAVKRESLAARVEQARAIVARISESDPVILWRHTNYEADALQKAFPTAIEVRGNQTPTRKEDLLTAFSRGDERMIITKPSIAGMGLNWQHCNQSVYVGVDFSFEDTFQSMGRTRRYGQQRDVHMHMIYSETEGSVIDILREKEQAFATQQAEMAAALRAHGLFRHVKHDSRFTSAAGTEPMVLPDWLKAHGGTGL